MPAGGMFTVNDIHALLQVSRRNFIYRAQPQYERGIGTNTLPEFDWAASDLGILQVLRPTERLFPGVRPSVYLLIRKVLFQPIIHPLRTKARVWPLQASDIDIVVAVHVGL